MRTTADQRRSWFRLSNEAWDGVETEDAPLLMILHSRVALLVQDVNELEKKLDAARAR